LLKTLSVFIALVLGLPLPAEADEQGPPNDTTSTEASATQADESATGNAWSPQGGGVIGASRHVGTVGIGYPGLRGMVHLPLGADFEIAPSVWLNYGFAAEVPFVSDTFTVQIKYRILQQEPLHVSLAADPGFLFMYHPGFLFSIELGLPQILFTYDLRADLALHFGFKMPLAFHLHPVFITRIPLLLNFGVEYALNQRAHLFAALDMGGDILVTGNGTAYSFFHPMVLFGTAVSF